MTLYLAFEALESDKLELTDRVVISRHAASQPPSRLGLGVGSSLTVAQAIRVIAVKSANDIAAALAEKSAEERRVGKECVSTCRARWSPDHSKTKKKTRKEH